MIIIPIKWLFHWEYTLFSGPNPDDPGTDCFRTTWGHLADHPMAIWRIGEADRSPSHRVTRPGYVNSLLLKMTIEIVSFPIKSGGSFHSFLLTFTRG